MREGLDQWLFVYATYALAIVVTLALVAWSWLAMRAAERQKANTRDSTADGSPQRRDDAGASQS